MNTRRSIFRPILTWLIAAFAIAFIGMSTAPAAEHSGATVSPEFRSPEIPAPTWRTGDRILYLRGCHSLESMQAAFAAVLAQRTDDPAYSNCFSANQPIPAFLDKREASLSTPFGNFSFWKIQDITEATEWIVLPDLAGPNRNNHMQPARYRPTWSASAGGEGAVWLRQEVRTLAGIQSYRGSGIAGDGLTFR